MALDIQRLTLRRILDTQDHDLYSKLLQSYFTGTNRMLFNKIADFYKLNTRLPQLDELLVVRKEHGMQEYIEKYILSEDNKNDSIGNEFLLAQLQDYYIRDETISYLDKFLNELEYLEKSEIADSIQNHLLEINRAIPYDDELFDVAEIDFFSEEDDFQLFSSGLSKEFDETNGGFATQELILLGGRRGSGKSIISLNVALNRFLEGNTVAFFSIEMRYKEVYSRMMSILSGVPFLDIFKNQLTPAQQWKIARARFDTFYEPSPLVEKLFADLKETQDFKKFEQRVKLEKPALKPNRFFIIDDPRLTLNRIDHYCNMFSKKYPNFNMAIVDYLNIIKHDDQKDWKTQIVIADSLKGISRTHDLTVLSPYQIDASGEARFAKGILDSADRSFNFFPAEENEDRSLNSNITVHTTKVRNGKHMSFDVPMDWECVRINPDDTTVSSERPHKAAMFGSDNEKKGPMDL